MIEDGVFQRNAGLNIIEFAIQTDDAMDFLDYILFETNRFMV